MLTEARGPASSDTRAREPIRHGSIELGARDAPLRSPRSIAHAGADCTGGSAADWKPALKMLQRALSPPTHRSAPPRPRPRASGKPRRATSAAPATVLSAGQAPELCRRSASCRSRPVRPGAAPSASRSSSSSSGARRPPGAVPAPAFSGGVDRHRGGSGAECRTGGEHERQQPRAPRARPAPRCWRSAPRCRSRAAGRAARPAGRATRGHVREQAGPGVGGGEAPWSRR